MSNPNNPQGGQQGNQQRPPEQPQKSEAKRYRVRDDVKAIVAPVINSEGVEIKRTHLAGETLDGVDQRDIEHFLKLNMITPLS